MRHKPRFVAIAVVGLVFAGGAHAAQDRTQNTRQMSVDRPANTMPAVNVTVSIPTIEAKGSSIDATTLKTILSGKEPSRFAELATLNADSIRIPEVRIDIASTATDGKDFHYLYKDIDLEGIKNGVAQTMVTGSVDSKSGNDFDMSFGKTTSNTVDIGGILALYGLVPGSSDQPPKVLYGNFSLSSGTFASPEFSCAMGSLATGPFKARPLKTSFGDLMQIVSAPEFEKSKPSPEAITKLLGFYVDLFDGFETSPMTISSLECFGKGEGDKRATVKLGPLTLGAFGHERYPSIDVKNLSVVAPDGQMSLGDFTLKSFDLSGPMAAIKAGMQAGPLTPDWFAAHARDLVPAFEGFAFNDVKLDVPNVEHPTQRVKATLADFDLSLSKYFGGVPTTISTGAHHFAFDLPAPVAGETDDYKELRDLGINSLDVGFDLKLHRDAEAKTIVVDQASVTAENLGSVDVSGVIGHAADELFTGDFATTQAAAMALTLKTLRIGAVDAGFGDLVLTRAGQEQKMDLATTRASMGAVAQGVVLASFGATPSGKALSDAVGKFINGTGKTISVTATSVDPEGLSSADLEAAQANPAALAAKVTIDATAK